MTMHCLVFYLMRGIVVVCFVLDEFKYQFICNFPLLTIFICDCQRQGVLFQVVDEMSSWQNDARRQQNHLSL